MGLQTDPVVGVPTASRAAALLSAVVAVVVVACDRDPVDPGERSFTGEPGLLSVHTVTSGRWMPDGGLQVWFDDDPATVEQLGLNGSAEFELPPGDHVVELFRGGGQPFYPACGVDGSRRREVTIESVQSTLVEFELFCEVALEFGISTTGANPDPDGYRLLVGPPWVVDQDRDFPVYTIPPNGSLTFDRDSPPWWFERSPDTRVYLWDAAPNCTLLDANPIVVQTGGGVVGRDVVVECVDAIPATGTIYFLEDVAGQVFRVEADGTGLTQVTDGPIIRDWTLSPDGSEIIFSPWHDGGLYRVGVDGTGEERIAPDDEWYDTQLHWGVDGRVLFAEYSEPEEYRVIYSMLPDGSDRRRLTSGEGSDPMLSPDGSTIAYYGPDGLTLMDPDGANPGLLHGGIDMREPRWSPDGARLAGVVRGESGWPEIAAVDVVSGELTFVARRPNQSLRTFAWSPDGDQLVFTALQGADDYPVDYEHEGDLFTVSDDGFNQARLTTMNLDARQLEWRE